jgi:multidrug efflux pump subunit AcrA (membrane-fusion protein)
MTSHNPVVAWLELEGRLLQARRPIEVAFIAVNEALALAHYRQSVLWSGESGVVALSGAALVEPGSPYVLWLDRVFRHLAGGEAAATPRAITAADLPPVLAEQWDEWLPAFALIVPMGAEAILFAREEPWVEADLFLLCRLADLSRLTRLALRPRSPWSDRLKTLRTRKARIITALAVLIGLFPVTGSVLAPADLVPAHPEIVRSPMDGVVDHILVRPNQRVEAGESLFDLDTTLLAGRLSVARQQQGTAETEYRQSAQAMVFDPKAKAQAALLAGKAEEKAAESKWLQSQLDRIQVKAPKAGLAVFDDASDWTGKPVSVGERVMIVADETDTEVEAWVAVADIGEVTPGAPLTLFLNTQPLTPVRAVVRSVGYEASARPDATLAHRVRAVLAEGHDKPRLGMKGTARIDGDQVPLVWWLFRRPLVTLRQTLGI